VTVSRGPSGPTSARSPSPTLAESTSRAPSTPPLSH
jgi:hypothetical protein